MKDGSCSIIKECPVIYQFTNNTTLCAFCYIFCKKPDEKLEIERKISAKDIISKGVCSCKHIGNKLLKIYFKDDNF